ncbi:MAG: ABC transporter permease [Bacteroidetes bacterium]|nr:ABC transporter permease [Bacteroidota bacterium]MDA1268313.1 ABC transporter permease [Bacteroidota bacterium]
MNLIENVREAFTSVKAHLLRTVLTGAIIAIGISSLVGMLTAIDGIKAQIVESFAGFGANSFDIRSSGSQGRRIVQQGKTEKTYPNITFREAVSFKEEYASNGISTIFTTVSGTAEIKRGSKKTNPNIRIRGGDENYLATKAIKLLKGRNFSQMDVRYGKNVAIIGKELKETLFTAGEESINQTLTIFGQSYTIIGLLDKQGGVGQDQGSDRQILIPIDNAAKLDLRGTFNYRITGVVSDPGKIDYEMGQAIGIMRKIRQDRVAQEDSFELAKSESVAESLEEVAGYLRIGGFGIGFITLLGAAIGLMNIMLVSVTERTREIGIRKALGATPLLIRQQFLIEAITICLIGGIFGMILGILIGNVIANYIGPGGFLVPWLWMIVSFVICIIVGLLAGYIPAFKASKLDPIESLRYE